MATRARAARLLTLDAAAAFDRGERCDMEAGMAKYFASEAALENSIESLRIHGGYGYSKEFDIERLYRDAPLMCIGEGTNEMQRIIIAKQWHQAEPGIMKPLAGMRVLTLEQFGAGPYGIDVARRLGAEVIKIENAATRRRCRRGTSARISSGDDDSQYFQTWGIEQEERHARPEGGRRAASRSRQLVADGRRRHQQPARRSAARSSGSTMRALKHRQPARSSACTSRPTAATTSARAGPATISSCRRKPG